MNVELLRKVQKKITGSPHLLNMNSWVGESECGTTCCIAGWVCVLSGVNVEELYKNGSVSKTNIILEAACRALDVGIESGAELAYTGLWPDSNNHEYWHACNQRQRAEATCRRIDAFIAKHEPASVVETEPELAFA